MGFVGTFGRLSPKFSHFLIRNCAIIPAALPLQKKQPTVAGTTNHPHRRHTHPTQPTHFHSHCKTRQTDHSHTHALPNSLSVYTNIHQGRHKVPFKLASEKSRQAELHLPYHTVSHEFTTTQRSQHPAHQVPYRNTFPDFRSIKRAEVFEFPSFLLYKLHHSQLSKQQQQRMFSCLRSNPAEIRRCECRRSN